MKRFLLALMLVLVAVSVSAGEGGYPKTGNWTGKPISGQPTYYGDAAAACDSYSAQYGPMHAANQGLSSAECKNLSNTTVAFTNYLMMCPTLHPSVGPDGLCYDSPPVQCADGTYAQTRAGCPVPPACAPGYVDNGINGYGQRICSARVCPAPSILLPDGRCGVPDLPPDGTLSGPMGPTGAQGDRGEKGDKGDRGDKGEKGDKGDVGDQGLQGERGEKGDKGDAGAAGATGAQGLKGDKGDRGFDGAQGAQGVKGDTGAQGAQGAQGLKGDTGAQGVKGDKGDTGAQGIQGIQGIQGAQGATGAQGERGLMGLQGIQGAQGMQGIQGVQGVQGETGKSFCEANPGLAACRDSTVSGACGDITCSGDAIQCATLRAAAAMQCKQAQDDAEIKASGSNALGAQVLSGNDPNASDLPTTKNAQIVDMPGSLDQSGWLSGGSFFPDKTITVQGKTIVIEFSKYGQYLLVLRYALMVVAFLVSFKIVSGAIIRE